MSVWNTINLPPPPTHTLVILPRCVVEVSDGEAGSALRKGNQTQREGVDFRRPPGGSSREVAGDKAPEVRAQTGGAKCSRTLKVKHPQRSTSQSCIKVHEGDLQTMGANTVKPDHVTSLPLCNVCPTVSIVDGVCRDVVELRMFKSRSTSGTEEGQVSVKPSCQGFILLPSCLKMSIFLQFSTSWH